MQGLTIGVYGLYLILVGLNGNAGALAGKVQEDAPKFLPWIIAIFVLAFLNSSSEAGRKITGPFIALLVVAFVLKRFDTLKSQSQQLWNMAAKSGTTPDAGYSTGQIMYASPNPSASYSTVPDVTKFSDALNALENTFSS